MDRRRDLRSIFIFNSTDVVILQSQKFSDADARKPERFDHKLIADVPIYTHAVEAVMGKVSIYSFKFLIGDDLRTVFFKRLCHIKLDVFDLG